MTANPRPKRTWQRVDGVLLLDKPQGMTSNAALQGALYGMQAALSRLKADGRLDEGGPVASFKERQRMVNKPFFDAQEKRYTNDTA